MPWNKGISKYPREQYQFILDHSDLAWKDIVVAFNKQFNTNVTKDSLNGILRMYQGNTRLNKIHKYSDEENRWLIENYPTFYSKSNELVKIFNEKFGANINSKTLVNYCNNTLNLRKENLKECLGNCSHTSLSLPIGSEYINSSTGYTFIKINDCKRTDKNNFYKNWTLKQKYVYEQHYGKIPDGYCVMFCDGNKQNFDINNLVLATPKEILHLKTLKWYGMGQELVRAGLELIRSEQVLVDLGAIKRGKGSLQRIHSWRKK